MKCDEMYVGKLTKDVVIRLVSVCPLRNNPGLVIWWRSLVILVVLVRSQQWWGRKLWTNGVFDKRFKVENEFGSIRWPAPLNIKGTAPDNKPVPIIFKGAALWILNFRGFSFWNKHIYTYIIRFIIYQKYVSVYGHDDKVLNNF